MRLMQRTRQGQEALTEAVHTNATVERMRVTTGNQMLDQFEPWYCGVAFAFLFTYCIGMPDLPEFGTESSYRRHGDNPKVPLARWVQIVSRRVEGQLSRDWLFGFVSWNLLFRSAVNLSKTFSCTSTIKKNERKRSDK